MSEELSLSRERGYLREIEIKFKKRKVKNGLSTEAFDRSEKVYALFKDLENEAKEKLICLSLDVRCKILCFEGVAIGLLEAVYASPVEILRAAIPMNPHGIILIHNHPSGDPQPSAADLALTQKLKEAATTWAWSCKIT